MDISTSLDLGTELQKYFGFDTFKGEQEKIIESILSGTDTFVIMPTGGGKSMCYQLPALMSEGTAIIISPLIALMKDQVDSIRSYGSDDSVAHFLNSSLNKTQIKEVKSDIIEGKTKLLYVAPETLVKEENIDFLKSVKVSFIAVDEAHCISEWGHDFRPEYRRIKQMIEAINTSIPIIALTATATPKVRQDIVKNLNMENENQFVSSFNRDNLYYEIRAKKSKEQTFKEIVQIIKKKEGGSGIVYVQSRKSTEEIAKVLNVNGIKAAAYHAGLDSKVRVKAQDDFLMEEVDVIVATIAFGMGIDKPDVRFVIHYDIAKSIENYYQETGRAGRDGIKSDCYAFYSYKDVLRLEKFLRDKPASERDLGAQLLDEVVSYSETAGCRRKYLLHYFGEHYDDEGCNKMCDNCRHPKEKQEVKDEMALGIKIIKELKENLTIKPLVDFTIGKSTQLMKDYKYVDRELFGAGKAKDELFWHSIYRQAILHDLVKKNIEKYGILMVTERGEEFLKSPRSAMIPLNRDFSKETASSSDNTKSTALDTVLIQLLKDLRKTEAKKKDIQPWVIFQEPSLIEMATLYPISMEDMQNISGVSRGKAIRYAKPFILLIKDYVEEHNIDRPMEVVVKQVANRSKNKVAIIQGIDKKLELEGLADDMGMSLEDLLQEMNNIVDSGTKLNINYYLEENMDEDTLEDIYDHFSEADSDSIEEALKELQEDDISLEEISMVRIKFMSEMAN